MTKGTHTDMKARMGALKQSKSVYCLHRRTVSCDDNIRVLGKGTEVLSSFPH